MKTLGSSIGAMTRIAAVIGLCACGATASRATEVDLALILAVDVSSSMNDYELRTQRDGYVSSLRHPDVLGAIESGARGRIALAYLEWAGPTYQRVLIPWTVIDKQADAERFVATLAAMPPSAESGTSISSALAFARELFAASGLKGDRWVVDVSGDGPNNIGPPVAPIRDGLIDHGITINGLAITLPRRNMPDLTDHFGEGYLQSYYEDCVVGGPEAFVIAIDDVVLFEVAIRRKLVREIVGLPARVMPASHRPESHPAVDCLNVGQTPGR